MTGKNSKTGLNSSEVFKIIVSEIEDYAIFLLDNMGNVTSWNSGAGRIQGYKAEEIIGKHFSVFYTEEEIRQGRPERELKIARENGRYEGEGIRVRKDGSTFIANVIINPLFDDRGELIGYIKVIRDITEKRELEKKKQRAERALMVLNRTSHTITHALNEEELLEKLCKDIVNEGYIYAWIGYAMNDRTVKPVTKAGKDGYADNIKITWDDSETGKGPTGTAIREKRVVIARDIAKEASFQPWRAEAIKRGYASSIALPIVYRDNVFGALNVYASEKDAFDEDEVKLLHEVANNLAFAIAMMRGKKREEKIREITDSLWKLITSEVDYRTFLNEVLSEIIKITDSKYGFFGIMDEDGKELIVHAWSKDVMEDCKVSDKTFLFTIEKGGLWAEAVRKRKRIIVNDYKKYPNKRLPDGHVPLTRFLIVPLTKDKIIFLIGVANKTQDYTEEDAEMLEFFMTNVQGILEKKRTEETYRILIENTGTAMMISDSETRIKFANEEVEKIIGIPREDLIGRSWVEFVSRDEVERVLEYRKLRDIDPSLAPRSFEVRLVNQKGDTKHVLLNVSMIPGSRDRIASFLDVTELRKTEGKLKESEERYRILFEKSRDGIILTGMDMRILDCNEAALRLSGLSKDEMIGKSFLDLGVIDKEVQPYLMEMFYKGMWGEVGTIELKLRLKGEVRWLEVSPTTLMKNKEPFAILNIIRDITDRKKTENELKMTLERLKILHELDMGIIESKPFKEISRTALRRLRKLIGCEAIGLFRYDESKNEIVMECSDSDVMIFEDECRSTFEPRLQIDRAKKGEILNVRDILKLEDMTDIEKELLKAGMRSYVDVPLIVRGEVMGILCLASNRPNAFDEKLQFIKEVSDQLAIALHEAKLFEMKMRSIEQIEKNIEEFAILVDHIRNPLAVISGVAELEIENENIRKIIDDAIKKIEDVVKRLDQGWLESEEIREFLRASKTTQS